MKSKAWVKRGLLLLLGLGLLSAMVTAWRPPPVKVDVGVVEEAPLAVTLTEPGQTRVRDRYVISAPVGGRLERIELKPGDPVAAGQLLAELGPLQPPPRSARMRARENARVKAARASLVKAHVAVRRAQVAMKLAHAEAMRQRALVEAGRVPPPVLEAARFHARSWTQELSSAQLAVKVAEQRLELAHAARARRAPGQEAKQLELRAPLQGRVLKVLRQREGRVAAGAPLLEVGDPAVMEVVVEVLSQDAVRIPSGAPVRIEQWGGEGPLEGRVKRVEPSAFTRRSAQGVREQRVRVVIALEDPLERRPALGDGYRVEARIALWQGDEVLQVPESALLRSGRSWAVYVAGPDGHIQKRRVEVGQRNGLRAQVLEGLRSGERVVVHPSGAVRDGVPYEVRPAA